jgi:probable HAF family extracellular repeat protein
MNGKNTCAFGLRAAMVCIVVLAGTGSVLEGGIVDIGDLGGGSSTPSFINLEGDVAGVSTLAGGASHAFFYSGITGMNDIGTFGATSSVANGLNASGEVSGTAGSVAFLYMGATQTGFNVAGIASHVAFGHSLNDNGVVAGSEFIGGGLHAFIATNQSGTPTDLGTTSLGGSVAEADFINNGGDIAGQANLAGNGSAQAYYSPGPISASPRTFVALHLGASSSNSSTAGINASGIVIGEGFIGVGSIQHGFVYTPNATNNTQFGTLQELVITPQDNTFVGASDAEAINSAGEVVGMSAINATQTHAYMYTIANGVQDLGTLMADNSGNSVADAINSQGWIVGTATSASGTDPFIDIAGAMYDLNTAAYRGAFTQLITATGINDNGFIIGTGIMNGKTQGYILDFNSVGLPTPEPVTGTSVGLVLLVTWVGARLRHNKRSSGDIA